MHRALDLASRGVRTLTNPRVGAVIVWNDRIIGEGYHQAFGQPHAEVNALNSVMPEDFEKLAHSTMYVTLEPCAHYGKTPPCVGRILESGIPNVVISCIDPNPLVSGKGIEILKNGGVNVTTGILHSAGLKVLEPYLAQMRWHRPYIILKYAQTKDGFIGSDQQKLLITGREANHLVHIWRSQVDGILIGTNTAKMDDPSLSTRLVSGRNPVRIVIDLEQKLSLGLRVFNDVAPTIRVVSNVVSPAGNNMEPDLVPYFLMSANARNIQTEMGIDKSQNLWQQVFTRLYQWKFGSVLVEGGTKTIESILESGYWDEIRRFTSPIIAGNIAAPSIRMSPNKTLQIGADTLEIFKNPELSKYLINK